MAHQNACLPIIHYPWPTSENVENGWPIATNAPFHYREFLIIVQTTGPMDHWTKLPQIATLPPWKLDVHFTPVPTWRSLWKLYTMVGGWWLWTGPHQKNGLSLSHWHLAQSKAQWCQLLVHQLPMNPPDYAIKWYWTIMDTNVTVTILTCPKWWGKLGQSDVCWVNIMTNKDSRFWFAMGQNHYECQTSQCGLRVVDAKCISKKIKSINQYASADMRLDSTFTPSTPMHPSPQSSLLSSFSRAPRPDPYTSS